MIRSLLAVLIAITPLVVSPRIGHARQFEVPYIPTASELVRLLGTSDVVPNEAENDGWDASSGFTIGAGSDRLYELFTSARILDSSAEAERFFNGLSGLVMGETERANARAMPEEAFRLNANDALDVRLIYTDPDLGERRSDYARILRIGRVVILVEALGDPEMDDRGEMDPIRLHAVQRTVGLMAGKVSFYPIDSAWLIPALEPFARDWGRHGASLEIDQTGHGEMIWRIYRWCSDDPTPPCDRVYGNEIDSGGGAAIAFLRVDGPTAHGIVIGSTDTETIALGPITVTLIEHGMMQLKQDGEPIVLCGPDFATVAPPSVRAEYPCGA